MWCIRCQTIIYKCAIYPICGCFMWDAWIKKCIYPPFGIVLYVFLKLAYQVIVTMYYKRAWHHYREVIMGTIASQITSFTIVYSTVYSGADQRKHQSSPSLAFVWGIHRGPVNSPHKWPVTGKSFHLMTSSWSQLWMRQALHTHKLYIYVPNPGSIGQLAIDVAECKSTRKRYLEHFNDVWIIPAVR